ncbi:type 1 glutamine amidotransferase [Rhodovulum sp. DZ06]|uniref:type 1 glutamine amidotransferase n=1 Tax=Rhodovulum sp. DZ06 TaxID=3425126 RepID=UPI003D3482DE
MLIGILQTGDLDPALEAAWGDYPAMFRKLLDGNGFSYRTWRVVDGVLPESPGDADAWLITGSRHGAYEDHPWIAPLEAFIRACRDADAPMAGICFGHQIMAQALGGKVVKADVGWGLGAQGYKGSAGELRLLGFHQDQVVELPAGAEVTAGSGFCPVAALRYGDWGRSWQGHPEFEAPFIRALGESKVGKGFTAEFVAAAMADAESAADGPKVGREIAAFFKARARAAA